jgi:hypothetical protein
MPPFCGERAVPALYLGVLCLDIDGRRSLDHRWEMAERRLEMRGALDAASSGASSGAAAVASVDVYFSADVETDGPIPGEFSMLSFGLVYAGRSDGKTFERPKSYATAYQALLRPISARFEQQALDVNGLDRSALETEGRSAGEVMPEVATWIRANAAGGTPVLVAYPLSFDWAWLYWYFVRFAGSSPFNHSRCFDLKTAIAVRGRRPIVESGHDRLPAALRSHKPHTHRALDDAIEQADMLARWFDWDGT